MLKESKLTTNNEKKMAKKNKSVSYGMSKNSHEMRAIYHFIDLVRFGFTEETWIEAAHVLSEISPRVSSEVRNQLGNLWQTCYVSSDPAEIDSKIELVFQATNG